MSGAKESYLKSLGITIAVMMTICMTCGCGAAAAVGIDAISSDGRWLTAVEYSGSPPKQQLLLLDVQAGTSELLASNSEMSTFSSFSSDNRYALVLSSRILLDLHTNQQYEFSTETVFAPVPELQFLPDGSLLMVSAQDNWAKYYNADPANPDNKTLLVDQVLFSFPVGRPEQEMFQHLGEAKGMWTFCEPSPVPRIDEQMNWLLITDDKKGIIIHATINGIDVQEISTEATNNLMLLVNRQLADSGIKRQAIEELVLKEAKEQGKQLTPEEQESLVENKIRSSTQAYILKSLWGELSPNGTKVLFLSGESSSPEDSNSSILMPSTGNVLYSVYLFDLNGMSEAFPLAFKTNWRPGFAFSPDGTQILFESNRDGGRSLYLANADGTEIRRVADDTQEACWY